MYFIHFILHNLVRGSLAPTPIYKSPPPIYHIPSIPRKPNDVAALFWDVQTKETMQIVFADAPQPRARVHALAD